jgi:hypothetical protein
VGIGGSIFCDVWAAVGAGGGWWWKVGCSGCRRQHQPSSSSRQGAASDGAAGMLGCVVLDIALFNDGWTFIVVWGAVVVGSVVSTLDIRGWFQHSRTGFRCALRCSYRGLFLLYVQILLMWKSGVKMVVWEREREGDRGRALYCILWSIAGLGLA